MKWEINIYFIFVASKYFILAINYLFYFYNKNILDVTYSLNSSKEYLIMVSSYDFFFCIIMNEKTELNKTKQLNSESYIHYLISNIKRKQQKWMIYPVPRLFYNHLIIELFRAN
jgi:hypothetical protein